jgi:hypothetical protein
MPTPHQVACAAEVAYAILGLLKSSASAFTSVTAKILDYGANERRYGL